jgi:5'-3' exonuclease
VDAPSLVYRALFSSPDTLLSPNGEPVNAVHGFLGMLATLIAGQDPDQLACADDHDWRPQWRVDLIGTYKLHRTLPGSPAVLAEDRLKNQIPLLWRILEGAGVPVLGHAGFEAEDVIGTLSARAAGNRVAIFSGDRDLFQLVRDPDVCVLYPRRGTSDLIVIDEAYVATTYGIPAHAYADFAVLRGDASDGLPGVRGIGAKTAAALLSRFGSLDAVLAAAGTPAGDSGPLAKVRRDREYVQRARSVVRIRCDVPLPEVDLTRRVGGGDALWSLAAANGLTNAVARLLESLG